MNPALERLADYPFARLRTLLADIQPPLGVTPLALSVGEPQHPLPAFAVEVMARHGDAWNRYPPIGGSDALREAAAGWLCRRFGLPPALVDPGGAVLPLSGTREGLFRVAQIAVGPGRDAVALPDPFYAPYEGAAIMAGAEPVLLPATEATGHLPDLDVLEADRALLDRLALFYLCSPSNPQGAVADRPYLDRLLRLARRHGFVLAADECYADLYDAAPPPSLLEAAAADGGALDGVLVFHSLSKRSNGAGLRSGFVAGDPRLIAALSRLASHAAAGMPVPIQAASAALWADDAHAEANRALYRAKFDAAEAALAGVLGFRRPAGGFFLWLETGDGEAAARRLWHEAGLRVLPGAYLSRAADPAVARGRIRVAAVHDAVTVGRAAGRIREILEPMEDAA